MNRDLHAKLKAEVLRRLPEAVGSQVAYHLADRVARAHADRISQELGYPPEAMAGAGEDKAMAVGPRSFPVRQMNDYPVPAPVADDRPGAFGADSAHRPANTPKGRRI